MKWTLAHLEARIENLFENFLGKPVSVEHILRQVAYALEDYTRHQGMPLAQINVQLNPSDYDRLKTAYPFIDHQVLAQVVELARHMGLVILPKPQLKINAADRQARGTVGVSFDLPNKANPISTGKMQAVEEEFDTTLPPFLPLAQLLQSGQVILSFEQYVVNIGRQADNHLVLDDPYISRHHCQIRWRHGRYVIYDLNSRHGSFVNQERVTERSLHNGDVLRLGRLYLVFLVDEPTDSQPLPPSGDTQPQPPDLSDNLL